MPALLPGPYDITVVANGFKPVHQKGVMLETDQKEQLDFAPDYCEQDRKHHGGRERATAEKRPIRDRP